jgi:hypothetical protein
MHPAEGPILDQNTTAVKLAALLLHSQKILGSNLGPDCDYPNRLHCVISVLWPRGLRRRYAAARMLGMRVRVPPGSALCQVEDSATGLSLVQRSPTECVVSECVSLSAIRRKNSPLHLQ